MCQPNAKTYWKWSKRCHANKKYIRLLNELCKLILAFCVCVCVSHSKASSCMSLLLAVSSLFLFLPFLFVLVMWRFETLKMNGILLAVVSSSVISISHTKAIYLHCQRAWIILDKVELFTLYCRKWWIINVNIVTTQAEPDCGGNISICNVSHYESVFVCAQKTVRPSIRNFWLRKCMVFLELA